MVTKSLPSDVRFVPFAGEDLDNRVPNLDSSGTMKASNGSPVVEELESEVLSRSFTDGGSAEQSLTMVAMHNTVWK